MSYTISITDAEVPADNEQAWDLHEELLDLSKDGEPSSKMLQLYHALKAQHPCIMEDPHGPWADGPLLGNFRSPMTTLGISYSRVEDTLPSVISIATSMGFVVFDAQDEVIHGHRAPSPRETDSVYPAPEQESQRKWWQIWK